MPVSTALVVHSRSDAAARHRAAEPAPTASRRVALTVATVADLRLPVILFVGAVFGAGLAVGAAVCLIFAGLSGRALTAALLTMAAGMTLTVAGMLFGNEALPRRGVRRG